jgi:hypothetical protein
MRFMMHPDILEHLTCLTREPVNAAVSRMYAVAFCRFFRMSDRHLAIVQFELQAVSPVPCCYGTGTLHSHAAQLQSTGLQMQTNLIDNTLLSSLKYLCCYYCDSTARPYGLQVAANCAESHPQSLIHATGGAKLDMAQVKTNPR